MGDGQRYVRTQKGQGEIAQGRKELKGKLRTALFLVDPGKDAPALESQFQAIGAPVDALPQLLAQGYIAVLEGAAAPPPASDALTADERIARFRIVKAFMNETIVDALGLRSFRFTLRLERCATAHDLVPLLPEYAEGLVRRGDRDAARALVNRTRELLADALR